MRPYLVLDRAVHECRCAGDWDQAKSGRLSDAVVCLTLQKNNFEACLTRAEYVLLPKWYL